MPSERDERLAQAERLIRRGDLPAAGDILRLLRDLFPDDAPIAARLAAVAALDDPRQRQPAPAPAVAPLAAPAPVAEPSLPADPVDLLNALLARVQQHRRD